MAQLFETKIDQNLIYFHGSSEAKVEKLEAPSFEHPFYVTSDLHYAMAFCTKNCSNTGEWNSQKIFTPASQNYVYVVSLKPDCQIFDFRDKESQEFKKLYKIIDKDIVDWIFSNNNFGFDMDDIYEFTGALAMSILKPISESHGKYLEYSKLYSREDHIMTPKLFSKACYFVESNGLSNAYENFDTHQIMAPLLNGLNKLGFQGILTKEYDYNDETKPSLKVSTNYAIGIFDVSGLDQLGLVPMKYAWLKKINPSYLQNATTDSANQKIKRFIQLYKKLVEKASNVNESSLDSSLIWYFGNNRCKNLRVTKPNWNKPFFLTTDYSYAEDYADYGVYKIELANEKDLNILDFYNKEEVQKLNWPKILVDKILEGKNDLNSIAYDLYLLANGNANELMYIQNNAEWLDVALNFQDRSEGIFKLADKKTVWGNEKEFPDHRFILQMWKDIYDAGFDGFTHIEFGRKVLALFSLKCIEKISINPINAPLNEKKKQLALKKSFKAKGVVAFPKISSDDDIVFVKDIPKDKALQLLKRAYHDVSNFHPEYMNKAIKWSNDRIFGLFNKHDKRNVLALASIDYNDDPDGAAYLHEMTGFMKGGYGKKLVLKLMEEFKKIYGQVALDGSGTKSDPYRPNEELRDKVYAKIPGLKFYRCENSTWDCPADFFYYGISDDSMKEFIEKTYGKKNNINESQIQNLKEITFPEEELADLSKRKHIVTHRVSDDVNQFNIGDIVETPWRITYEVSNKTMINDISDSPYIKQLTKQQVDFLKDFNEIAIIELNAIYEPPYTLDQIKQKYPENVYEKLSSCPIHRWRAETGIELIHKEPTEEELDRIWKNWQLMPQEMKDKSEQKSLETFGMTNAEHYKQLKKHKDINKEQINEIQNDIYIEEVKIYQAKKLIDEVQDKHLYDVYPFEPNNIRMGASTDDRFFVGYVGQPCVENATAVIAVMPNYPYGGFFYVDQITGIKKGYGIKTLEALLTKNRSWRNKKIWWLSSPMKRNEEYYENTKLNSAYRSIPGIKEYRKEDTPWGCPTSWFYTANCGNSIEKYIDDGNWN